jgi:hypothetical protein
MMKISHSELESCLRRPSGWFREKMTTRSHGYLMGYNRALLLSIYHFHKTGQALSARRYIQAMIKKHSFRNAARIDEIELGLDSYLRWCKSESLIVADSRVRINFGSGFLRLTGEISRVDVTPDCYRAVLLGPSTAGWQGQLRMPLIQKAISMKFGRPAEEVAVGIQDLDGANLEVVGFSPRVLRIAEQRFARLARQIELYSSNYPSLGNT